MFVVEKEPSYGSGRKNGVWVKTRMEESERLRWRERGRLTRFWPLWTTDG